MASIEEQNSEMEEDPRSEELLAPQSDYSSHLANSASCDEDRKVC
jgi:hypothetical protein